MLQVFTPSIWIPNYYSGKQKTSMPRKNSTIWSNYLNSIWILNNLSHSETDGSTKYSRLHKCAVQCSSVKCSTVQLSVVQYRAVQYSQWFRPDHFANLYWFWGKSTQRIFFVIDTGEIKPVLKPQLPKFYDKKR